MTEPRETLRDLAPWVLAVVILAGLRLWLTSYVPVSLLDHDVDDSLYLRHARAIAAGEWLGAYDQNLLVKGPGYGAFLAGASLLHVTRRTAEDALQILAALVMAWCLRRLRVPRVLTLLAFGLIVFHPACLHGAGTRVAREGVYLAQTVLVLALGGALIPAAALRARLAIATALGLVLSWTWQTRGEGVWFLPPLALCAVAAVLADRRAGARTPASMVRVGACATIAAAAVLAGSALVSSLNERHYGAAVTTELEDGPFNAAVGALQRVADSDWSRYEPLSAELRAAIANESAAYAEVSDAIERRVAAVGPPERAPTGGMMGIFFSWALRDAAAEAGHHRTLPESRAFYRRLAEEVNAACDAGRLPGGDPRTHLTPRLDSSLLGTFAAALRHDERELLAPRWIRLPAEPPLPLDLVRDDRTAAEAVLGEPLVTPAIASLHRRWAGLRTLATAARRGATALRVLGLACLLSLAFTRRGRGSAAFWFAVALEVALLTRAGLVASLETWWFRDVAIYLIPAAPLGGLVGTCALGGALAGVVPRRGVGWLALGVSAVIAVIAASAPGVSRRATAGPGGDEILVISDTAAGDAVSISPGRPADLHVVSPRKARGTLELDLGRDGTDYVTVAVRSWRFSDGAIRPVVRRRFLTSGRRVRVPVDVLPAHPLTVSVADVGEAVTLRSCAVSWRTASPRSAPALRVARRGEDVEAAITDGVPGGVYVVFFATRRLAHPVDDPVLSGRAELDTDATVLGSGRPVHVVVEVGVDGRGAARADAAGVEAGTWAQGVGEDWLTMSARVTAGK